MNGTLPAVAAACLSPGPGRRPNVFSERVSVVADLEIGASGLDQAV
ncbi:MAG TPA: hypothetical protein VH637_05895 [Streptosporangiaceae bacterium]|jgi:hypothetical protein